MIILGIDPGLATTGYGIIKIETRQYIHLTHGIISTAKSLSLAERLSQIHQELTQIISIFKPDKVAVEELFVNKNVKTAMVVGAARGVILLTVAENHLPLFSFTPLQIKQALVSYGRASKQQVQLMVQRVLMLPEYPRPDDAADGLAAAICCAQTKVHII